MILTNEDLRAIGQLIDKTFDEKFDEKFDKKFDEKFDEKFDQKFDEKFDQKFNGILHEKFTGMAAKADLEGMATKADLEGMATKADLEGMATRDDLDNILDVRLRELENNILEELDLVQEKSNEHFESVEKRLDVLEEDVRSLKQQRGNVSVLFQAVADLQGRVSDLEQAVF